MSDRSPLDVVMLVRNPFTNDSRVEKEAATLQAAGHRVTVVADAAPGLADHDVVGGVTVVRVPRRAATVRAVRYAAHEYRLLDTLTALAPSVLHAHDSNALFPVGVAASRLKIPFIYDAHELWLHRPRRGHRVLYHEMSRGYYAALQRWLVPRAAAVLTVSPPIQRHLARAYGVPVELVPNYPELRPPPAPAPLRSRLGDAVPEAAPLVLHLGGIMATRGLEQLVAAMVEIPDAHLVFVGGGDDASLGRVAAEGGLAGRIHFVPAVPSAEVEAYAAAADIGVLTTLPIGLNNRYSLANKLFQYMAAGIPVVASDFPQIREVVVGSGAGLVVDTRRPAEIARAVSTLLADREGARRMGRQGRQAVEDRYNWSVSAAALLDVYDRIAAGRRPG